MEFLIKGEFFMNVVNSINKLKLYVLDIETTDLDPTLGNIVEVGIVCLDLIAVIPIPILHVFVNECSKDEFEKSWVAKNGSVRWEDVEKGVSYEDLRKVLFGFSESGESPVVIAYNKKFDFEFIKKKTGLTFYSPIQDPMLVLTNVIKIKRKNGNGYKYPSVQEALEYFKINIQESHSALFDAYVESLIIAKMINLGIYDISKIFAHSIKEKIIRYYAKKVTLHHLLDEIHQYDSKNEIIQHINERINILEKLIYKLGDDNRI